MSLSLHDLYRNKIVEWVDSEINNEKSDCSRGNLRRRKLFVKDEGDLLNTDIFLSIENEEIDNLQSYLKLYILTVEELST